MSDKLEKLIEEARELDAKATAGPGLYKHMSVDGETISKGLCHGDGDWFTPTADDWAFIAAARSIVPELVSAIATLSAELAKAREVIAKLPKTADGVPIVLGMRIFYWHHGLNEVRSVTAKQMDQTWSAHKGDDVDSGWVRWAPTDGYSTEAAALAALAAKGAVKP